MLRDAAALLVTFGLTGWLLSLVVLPKPLGLARRTGLSLALAVPGTVLAAAPGLLLSALSGATFVAGVGGLAVGAAARCGVRPAALLRPGQLTARAREAARQLAPRPDRRTLVTALLTLAVVASGWAAVVQSHTESPRSSGLPRGVTVWFYWELVRETAAEGGLPDTRLEWGESRPFPAEYIVTTVHAATTAKLAGGTELQFLERYRLFMVLLGLAAAFAMWRRWLPGWWAWTAALLTLAAPHIANRFVSYRPETFGLLLVLWSAWLLDEALERRSPRWAALAAVVSACAFMAHAEIWLITAPLWLGIVVSRLLPLSGRGTDPTGNERTPVRALAIALAVGAVAFVASTAALSLMADGGERVAALAGFGEEKEEVFVEGAPEAARYAEVDPTWALHAAMYVPANLAKPPPNICTFFTDRKARSPYVGVDMTKTGTQLGLLGLGMVALGGGLLARRGPQAARGVVVLAVLGVGIILLAGAVCQVYDNYVPERAGPQRIQPFYVLPMAGLLATIGWLASGWLAALGRRRLGDRPAARFLQPGLTAAVSIALVLWLAPVTGGRPADLQNLAPVGPSLSDTAFKAYEWMADHLPAHARVLANGYTEGSLGAVSGRLGILDGRAPYLESPEWRAEAIRELLDAREFFLHPIEARGRLADDVDYVLVATTGAVDLGGSRFPFGRSELFSSRGLRFVRGFDGKNLLLFEVTGEGRPEPVQSPSRSASRSSAAPQRATGSRRRPRAQPP